MRAPFTRWSLIALAVTLGVAAVGWTASGGSIFNPGALHAGGAAPERLGGVDAHAQLRDNCAACHPAPWSAETMSDRCLACHSDVRQELGDTTRLHGSFSDAGDCVTCHTEHRGPRANLTRLDDLGAWHNRLGFALAQHRATSTGQVFTCNDCHGPESFQFDPRQCADCHDDYQAGFITAHSQDWGDDCLACHDGARFGHGSFNHGSTAFPLAGKHAEITCIECHPQTRAYEHFALAAGTCVGCHRDDDVHRGEFGADCGACHGATTWEGATFDHTFPIDHGRRTESECAVCHPDGPQRYRTYTCYGCHEHDPAEIRREHVEEGIRDYADCMECHPTGREDEED